jgi:hypothetical protein
MNAPLYPVASPAAVDLDDENPDMDFFEIMQDVIKLYGAANLEVLKKYQSSIELNSAEITKMLEENGMNFIKQCEKSRSGGLLAKIGRALGIIAFCFAVVAVVVAPSPLTLSLCVMSAVLVFEPIISEAAGEESLVGQGMAALLESCINTFGKEAGIAIAVIAMIVITVAATALMSAAFSAIASGAPQMFATLTSMSTSLMATVGAAGAYFSGGMAAAVTAEKLAILAQQFGTVMASMKEALLRLPEFLSRFAPTLNQTQVDKLLKFSEYAQASISASQGGVSALRAETEKQLAEILEEFNVTDAIRKNLHSALKLSMDSLNDLRQEWGEMENSLPKALAWPSL